MKKVKTLHLRWQTIKINIVWNSTICGEVNSEQVKVFFCTAWGTGFSVAHGGENDINRHKDTSKDRRYVDAAQ